MPVATGSVLLKGCCVGPGGNRQSGRIKLGPRMVFDEQIYRKQIEKDPNMAVGQNPVPPMIPQQTF